MDNLFNQKVINANNVFGDHYLDAKTLYLYCFNVLPSLHYIGHVDGEKAYAAFKEKFGGQILRVHQYRWYKNGQKKYQFDQTLLILDNQCLLEFG